MAIILHTPQLRTARCPWCLRNPVGPHLNPYLYTSGDDLQLAVTFPPEMRKPNGFYGNLALEAARSAKENTLD